MGAAASKPTRPLIPMIVSPTCMSRPIPYAAPISSTFWMALIGSSNVSSLTAFSSPFSKVEAQLFAALFGAVFQIGTFGQSLRGIQDFATTDGSTPQTYVIGIFQFGEVGVESVFVQIIDFFLTAQCHVAGQRDDFHVREP